MQTPYAAGRTAFSLRTKLVLLAGCVALAASGTIWAQASPTGPLPAAEPKAPPPEKPAIKMIGGRPNLSGSWTLNHDQSDDARKKIEDAMDRGRSRGGSAPTRPVWPGVYWPRGPWGYPYPRPPRPSGGGGGGRSGGSAGSEFMADFEQLSIQQSETTIRVMGQSGNMLAVYPVPARAVPAQAQGDNAGNGSDASAAMQRPMPASEWEGNQLIFKQPWASGSTSRTYELSPDGKQLHVTTQIDNPRLKKVVTIRYVYDPTASGG